MTHLTRIERVLLVLAAVVIAGALSATALFTAAHHFATLHTYTLAGDFFELATGQVGEFTSEPRLVTEVVREVPVESVPVRPIRGSMEMTSTVTQEFRSIDGVGSEPTEPLELLSEGLWLVSVRFVDDEPPDVEPFPSVSVTSISGDGGVAWSEDWWNRLYVTADSDWAQVLGERMAVFAPGEVVVQISDLPDDVAWWVEFERLGELKMPQR
ncbi:MAG: hypothetical protein OXG33_08700 [Chloroflexi bacterium]|nr:hypothetical protein [Chloroflexota bacterium]